MGQVDICYIMGIFFVVLFWLLFIQAALKAAKPTKDSRDEEIAALRSEIEVKISISIYTTSWVLSICVLTPGSDV